MAEENSTNRLQRAVVVEFDFTALDGATILYNVAKERLAECGVKLTPKLEALHLANGNCQGAVSELFTYLDIKGDAAKTAREITDAFRAALAEKIPAAVDAGFKAFAAALAAKNVKLVIATRADIDQIRPAFDGLDKDLVTLYSEPSTTYGNCKWDAWRRAARANDLHEILTVAVTGSGHGVKSALVAGMSAIAIVHDHVAYQDFGGAEAVADGFSAKLADDVFRMLHLDR